MFEPQSGNLRPLRAGDRIEVQDYTEGLVMFSVMDSDGRYLEINEGVDVVLLSRHLRTTKLMGIFMIELMAAALNLNAAYLGKSRTGKDLFELVGLDDVPTYPGALLSPCLE